jgi:hypothetical protein
MAKMATMITPVIPTKRMSHTGRSVLFELGSTSETLGAGLEGGGVEVIVTVAVVTGVISGRTVAILIATPLLVNLLVSIVLISPSLTRAKFPLRAQGRSVSVFIAHLTLSSVVPVAARKAYVSFQGEGINCT